VSRAGRLLRDPLLHFLAAGGLLFGAYYLFAGPATAPAEDKTIEVDRAKLLTFLQYQSMAFEPKYFNTQLDAMSPQARRELIDKYVQEEALYREAQAMGLSQGDYVIRRRVVQKILYLLDDTTTESFDPTDAQLQAYFTAHQDRYSQADALTFTQVFVDGSIARPQGAEAQAERLKRELTAKRAGFTDAGAYGDRFPYQQNYVARDDEFVKAQFGREFADAVLKLQPSDRTWYGPIKSQFGYHLVLLTAHSPRYLPPLAQVREEVKDDLMRDSIEAYRNKGVADLVGRFKVKLQGISISSPEKLTAEAGRSGSALP
jgi:parvulin-like peptidyl-prolyl isomerase